MSAAVQASPARIQSSANVSPRGADLNSHLVIRWTPRSGMAAPHLQV